MGVGIDADTEYLRRSSIPSGGAGTLSDGGFTNCFVGVWVYRDSADVTYALTAGGAIIHMQSAVREVVLGFDSAGVALGDLSLRIIFNSGGGAGTPGFFTHAGDEYVDEWIYYFILENATDGQTAGFIRLSNLAEYRGSIVRANDNAGSQYVNTLTFGNNSSGNACALGWYAKARAVYASGITDADVLAYAAMDAPDAGDWGYWPIVDNADTGDDSGNGRTLTFNGTLTSEDSPILPGAGSSILVPSYKRMNPFLVR